GSIYGKVTEQMFLRINICFLDISRGQTGYFFAGDKKMGLTFKIGNFDIAVSVGNSYRGFKNRTFDIALLVFEEVNAVEWKVRAGNDQIQVPVPVKIHREWDGP